MRLAVEQRKNDNTAPPVIFDFCTDAGLVASVHNDIDMPFHVRTSRDRLYLSRRKNTDNAAESVPLPKLHSRPPRLEATVTTVA